MQPPTTPRSMVMSLGKGVLKKPEMQEEHACIYTTARTHTHPQTHALPHTRNRSQARNLNALVAHTNEWVTEAPSAFTFRPEGA